MKRKLWIILALAALVVALCVGTALADINGNINSDITWTLSSGGVLTINGTGAIPDYGTAYNLSPFDGNTNIREVVVEGGITALGNNLFFECANLTKATIKNPDAGISSTAFRNCPSSLKLYGWSSSTAEAYAQGAGNEFVALWGACGNDVLYEFHPDTAILTIYGNGSMTEFTNENPSPFNGRADIIYVDIRPGVTSVGAKAFYNCGNLVSVFLSDTVTVIGNEAFRLCYALAEINLPDGLTRIDDYAFYNDSQLSDLVIPASVTYIGNQAFRYCYALEELTVLSRTATFSMNPLDAYTKINLRGYSGSTAQSYANSHSSNVTFVNIEEIGSCGDNVTYSFDPYTGELTISGTGEMTGYNSDADVPWYSYRGSIDSVSVGSGITYIGSYAFYGFINLTSVTIPDGVTSIGTAAFVNCDNLTSVTIPDSVTRINGSAFANCDGLTSVTLPNSVVYINGSAFNYCGNLTSVIIQNPEAHIGSSAFDNCSASLTIHGWTPSTAKTYATENATENNIHFESLGDIAGQIGDDVYYAFDPVTGALSITGTGSMWDFEGAEAMPWTNYRASITSATIASGVTSIGDYAFYHCDNLTSLTIPASVNAIGEGAFSYSSVTSLAIPNGVTTIRHMLCDNCKNLTSVTIPTSVTTIESEAFRNCTSLSSAALPSSVREIGDDAFAYTALTSVTIPNGVTEIGNFVFADCTSLANVSIPNSVTSIGFYAFTDCTSLTSVTIPNSVTSIGDSAFASCTGLTSVTIPGSVNIFGENVFSECIGLTSATFQNGVTSIGRLIFNSCYNLENVTIPDSVTYIDYGAFNECYSLTSITIPNSVTSIDEYAFANCTGLTNVTIPNRLTSISNGTFSDCSGLTSVTIPNSVTSIGSTAFYHCINLTSVTIPNSVTSINQGAFSMCINLPSVSIPSSVTSIGKEAFKDCWSLEIATVHNASTTFGADVFKMSGTAGVTLRGHTGSTAQTYANSYDYITFAAITAEMSAPDFTLPAATTRIEAEAFSGAKMSVVYIPDGVTFLGSKAFAYCTNLTQIRIPASITTIPADVFYNVPKANITIFGAPGSAAQTYANNAGIQFEVE